MSFFSWSVWWNVPLYLETGRHSVSCGCMDGATFEAEAPVAHRGSTLLPAYPCLLACLGVVLHKDGVRGGEVKGPDAGLSLAWRPVQETHIFHLYRIAHAQYQRWKNAQVRQFGDYLTVITDKKCSLSSNQVSGNQGHSVTHVFLLEWNTNKLHMPLSSVKCYLWGPVTFMDSAYSRVLNSLITVPDHNDVEDWVHMSHVCLCQLGRQQENGGYQHSATSW